MNKIILNNIARYCVKNTERVVSVQSEYEHQLMIDRVIENHKEDVKNLSRCYILCSSLKDTQKVMKFREYKKLLKRIYKKMSKKERKRQSEEWTLADVLWNWHEYCGFNLFG